MKPEEILDKIAQQSGGAMTKANIVNFINAEIEAGAQVMQQDNTLIVFKSTQKTTVMFYLFSLDDVNRIGEILTVVFDIFKKMQYEIAETHYDVPALNRVYVAGGAEVTQDPEGGFRAKVRL